MDAEDTVKHSGYDGAVKDLITFLAHEMFVEEWKEARAGVMDTECVRDLLQSPSAALSALFSFSSARSFQQQDSCRKLQWHCTAPLVASWM